MTIEQVLNKLLQDGQAKVGELSYDLFQLEKLRRANTSEYKRKQDIMFLLLDFMDFMYEKWYILYDPDIAEPHRIVDWSDDKIIRYVNKIYSVAELESSSQPVELGYVPPALVRYSIHTPGSLNNIPIGTPGYKMIADSNGLPTWVPDTGGVADAQDSFDDF